MWSDLIIKTYDANLGGVQTEVPPTKYSPSQTPASQDIYSDPYGAIRKRDGKTEVNATALSDSPAITGIYQVDWDDKSKTLIASASDGTVHSESAGTFTQIASGYQTGPEYYFSFAKLNNLAIWANGADTLKKWDGTTVSALSGFTLLGKILVVAWRRLWVFGVGINPYLGYWSGLGNPESWDLANDYLNFDTGDGDPVTAAVWHEDTIYVFKNRRIFRVYATGTIPEFTFDEIKTGVGCPSCWGAKSTEAGLFVLGNDNVYRISGNEVTPVADSIQNVFLGKSLGELPGLNTNRLQYAQSGVEYTKKQFWLLCSKGPSQQHDYIWMLDWRTGAWYPYTIAANTLGRVYSGGRDRLYSGNYAGQVFKQDQGTDDDGTNIDGWYITPHLDLGDPDSVKRFLYIAFAFEEIGRYFLEVYWKTDADRDWEGPKSVPIFGADKDFVGLDFIMGQSEVGVQDFILKFMEIYRRGRYIQFKFRNRGAEKFTIYKYTVIAQPISMTVEAVTA